MCHAAPKPLSGPVLALAIAMVLTAELAPLMAGAGSAPGSSPSLTPATQTTVDLAAIASSALSNPSTYFAPARAA